MKKLLGIAFVGMMALGCGGGSKQAQDPNTAASPPPAQTDPNAAPAQGTPSGDATQGGQTAPQ